MTATLVATTSSRLYRGWIVLAGIFVVMTVGSGFAFYAQGVFLEALVDEQGFSVGTAGAGTGFFFIVSGVSGYFAGGLISRYDIRIVMVFGATVAAAGIYLLGEISSVWQMFLVFLVYGAGYALAGLVPATSLVTRWFHVKRSIALSIASTGLSVGGIAITPVIAQLIDARSLVELAPRLALAFWIGMVPVIVFVLKPSPESLGLRPDGAPVPPHPANEEAAAVETGVVGGIADQIDGTPFAVAVRTRYFRLLSASFILIMGAQVGVIQHIFKLTKDQIDVYAASLALAVVTGTSVCARLIGGVAATRIPLRNLTSALIVVQVIGIIVIGLAGQRLTILVGVVIFGMAMGNLLMLHPLLLADAFGIRDYPRIYGLGSLLMVTGVGLGPFIVGLLRDAADYRTAFLVMAAVALVGLAIYRAAGEPPE
jgi:MFS family permease